MHNVLNTDLDASQLQELYLCLWREVWVADVELRLVEQRAERIRPVLSLFFGLLLGFSRLRGDLFGIVNTAVHNDAPGEYVNVYRTAVVGVEHRVLHHHVEQALSISNLG